MTAADDWISFTVNVIVVVVVIEALCFPGIVTIFKFIGLALCHAAHCLIKHVFCGARHAAYRRPDDACDCNAFNLGGPCGGAPGMPSGHVTAAAFFYAYTFLQLRDVAPAAVALFGTTHVAAVAASRLRKRCHNAWQVIAGCLLGGVVAIMAYFLKLAIDTNKDTPRV